MSLSASRGGWVQCCCCSRRMYFMYSFFFFFSYLWLWHSKWHLHSHSCPQNFGLVIGQERGESDNQWVQHKMSYLKMILIFTWAWIQEPNLSFVNCPSCCCWCCCCWCWHCVGNIFTTQSWLEWHRLSVHPCMAAIYCPSVAAPKSPYALTVPSPVTKSKTSISPLGCVRTGDWQHGCVADIPAKIVWYDRVDKID